MDDRDDTGFNGSSGNGSDDGMSQGIVSACPAAWRHVDCSELPIHNCSYTGGSSSDRVMALADVPSGFFPDLGLRLVDCAQNLDDLSR